MKHSSKQFHEPIFNWWKKEGRVLPWRERLNQSTSPIVAGIEANAVRESVFESYFDSYLLRDPYPVVVSEVMLQQTQVDRVKTKYVQWMKKWPRINDLSNARLSEVIVEWKGLGYNRRARFLWLLAKEIVEQRGGVWPQTEKELMKLPGVGRYTARAVMSFCFNEQVGVVDTNVKRIFSRWLFEKSKEQKEEYFFQLADEMVPSGQADPWNQAMMDFGALICTAKKPKCVRCPVAEICKANVVAKKEGYEHYAAKLQANPNLEKVAKPLKKSKDILAGKKLKFEATDRYLRGRIVDLLREKDRNKEELTEYLSNKYVQFSLARIEENIRKLEAEKLIELT